MRYFSCLYNNIILLMGGRFTKSLVSTDDLAVLFRIILVDMLKLKSA